VLLVANYQLILNGCNLYPYYPIFFEDINFLSELTLELHISQMQNGSNRPPNGLHLVRGEAQGLEGVAGALVVGLLRQDVHAALVQVVVLARLLLQFILSQLVVAGTAK